MDTLTARDGDGVLRLLRYATLAGTLALAVSAAFLGRDRLVGSTAAAAAASAWMAAGGCALFLIVWRTGRMLRHQRRDLEASRADLRNSELKFRSVTESAPDAIISIGTFGRVVSWNLAAERIFGYAAADMLGRDVAAIIPEAARPAHAAALKRLLQGEAEAGLMDRTVDLEGLRRDGTTVPVELTLSRWEMDGKPHFTAILRDMSERRRKERELLQALDRLTETNAELERFAYVASHDLQEPLRSVASFAQLLHRRCAGRLDAEADEYIDFIVAAAKRMHALINDLLDYSRVTGKGGTCAPVPAGRACRAALDNLHEAIAAAAAEVTVADLPEVMADEVQLVQLFQNLVGNAVKFHRPDVPPRVAVAARPCDGAWEFTVADNGIGLADTEQDIFEVFRRLHTTQAYPGTGIGLAVCKRIVQRHDGRIWATSEPGSGTTFHVTLPAA